MNKYLKNLGKVRLVRELQEQRARPTFRTPPDGELFVNEREGGSPVDLILRVMINIEGPLS